MKLTKIERVPEDTGVRALATWGSTGVVIFGELPSGMSPLTGKAGGIWIRRVRERVTLSIVAAQFSTSTSSIPVPEGFRVLSVPYPDTTMMPVEIGPVRARVGASYIFLSGLTAGRAIPDSSGSYAAIVTWDSTQPMPHPDTYPGLPA